MPFSLHFSRRSGRHYVMSSVAADGCFLSGECSFFLCFNQKHFIALLRVFGFAAVCFGCLHRDFLLKSSERASSRLE